MFELYTYRDNVIQSTALHTRGLMPVTLQHAPWSLVLVPPKGYGACDIEYMIQSTTMTTMTLENPTFTISSVSPAPPLPSPRPPKLLVRLLGHACVGNHMWLI